MFGVSYVRKVLWYKTTRYQQTRPILSNGGHQYHSNLTGYCTYVAIDELELETV